MNMNVPPRGPAAPSKYMKHDQCEGQLFQFIDALAETLYNTPEDATHYGKDGGAPRTAANTPAAGSSSTPSQIVEIDDDGKEQPSSAATTAAAEDPNAGYVPVISKFEIAQTDSDTVLNTLMSARKDLFVKLQSFMKAVVKHVELDDAEATVYKNDGNKAFIAYQNEVASWGCSGPSNPRQKAEAQRQWEVAFNNYTVALSKAKSSDFIATVLNNRATILFAGKQFRDAALDCNYCLKLNPTYYKALQRRAMCMGKLGYESVGEADEAYAKKKMEEVAAAAAGGAAVTADDYDLRFNLHDTLLHAFQNVGNYADHADDEEETAEKKASKGPNPKVLSAATRLSAPSTIIKLNKEEIVVDRDAKRGRFVSAKQKLPAGTTVLIETPYAAASHSNAMGKCCAFCLRPTKMLYPCDQYRAAGVRSRGMFCSSECASLNWDLYGERESSNVFFNICPIDALLAARVQQRKANKIAVLVPAAGAAAAAEKNAAEVPTPTGIEAIAQNPLSAVAAFLTLAVNNKQREHINIDSVGDNKFGKDHMDALCTFSAELFPGLSDAGGRETILTAVAQYYAVFRKPLSEEELAKLAAEAASSSAAAATSSESNTDKVAAAQLDAAGKVSMAGDKTAVNNKPLTAEEKADAEQFRKILRQITVNAFPITFQERIFSGASESHDIANTTAGKAMYAVASLFNHSCDPNCIVTYAGHPHAVSTQLHIKTIRPVQEGEELSIAYGNPAYDKFHLHSTRSRIRELRSKYGFACVCTACFNEVDEPIPKEKEQYYHKASDYYQKGRRLMRERNFDESVTVLLQSYEIVMRYICPPPLPPQWMLVNTHEALAQSYNFAGNKKKVVEHLKAALSLSLQLYDKHATQIAVNLGAVALQNGDHQESDEKEEGESAAAAHPRNHQPDRATGIVPGTPSPLALSATFLASADIQCHANVAILQSFIRLTHMCAAVGRAEEEQHRVHAEAVAKKSGAAEEKKGGDDAAASAESDDKFVSNYTKDARKFALRSIDLLKLFYSESAALDAELLELEVIARK